MNEELNYSIELPENPLSMWRVFYPDGIQFKYIMYNMNSGKYNFINFSRNIIEPGVFDSEAEAINKLESLLKDKVISAYQKI